MLRSPQAPTPRSTGHRGEALWGMRRWSEERRRRLVRERRSSVVISFLMHAALTTGFLLLPKLFEPPPKPIEFVAVTVVPPAMLGVEEPPPPPPAAPPKPAPPKPAPPPPAAPLEPSPPAAEEVPVLKRERKAKTETRPGPPPPPPAASPASRPGLPTSNSPARRKGSPFGSPLGSSASRTIVGVEDPNFTFGYYLDRVAAAITGNWVRPKLEERVEALFYFRISRDGTISDLELRQTSGLRFFDDAAERAIESSSPLPPLPRGYRKDYLGINLIVR